MVRYLEAVSRQRLRRQPRQKTFGPTGRDGCQYAARRWVWLTGAIRPSTGVARLNLEHVSRSTPRYRTMNAPHEDIEEHAETSAEKEDHQSKSVILKAIQALDLHQHHETIHDPNELIDGGFPANFLLPLIRIFDSSGRYQYVRQGRLVEEMIGISHLNLIYAVADYLGVSSEVGLGFTGRGFSMNAKIDAIESILNKTKDGA